MFGVGLVEIVLVVSYASYMLIVSVSGERAASLSYVYFATGLEFEFVNSAVRILLFALVSQVCRWCVVNVVCDPVVGVYEYVCDLS